MPPVGLAGTLRITREARAVVTSHGSRSRTKKYLSALKGLQQAQGTYQDTTVATDLVASLGANFYCHPGRAGGTPMKLA
jgi:hypothetical protein